MAGIDFGAHSAKIVVAAKSPHYLIVQAAARIEYPSYAEGAEQLVGQWLNDWCDLPLQYAACSLPAGLTEYEAADVPQGVETSQAAAESAINQLLGAQQEQACWDYWKTSNQVLGDKKETLHLVWLSQQAASQSSLKLAHQGIVCEVIDATPSALAKVANPNDSALRLVVNLGHESTDLVLAQQGQSLFVRHRRGPSFGVATNRVADAMEMQRHSAETILSEWGCYDTACPICVQVTSHLKPWMQEVAFEIERTLGYLEHRYANCLIQEVVLCGGGACVRGFSDWLSEELSQPVVTAEASNHSVWQAATPYDPSFAEAIALLQSEGA